MSGAFLVRDYFVALWKEMELQIAEHAMRKIHKQFNTRLGFPVTYCTPNRMSLTDSFKPWQKNAAMTNDLSRITCENCKRELG